MISDRFTGSAILFLCLQFTTALAASDSIQGQWQCRMTYQGMSAGAGMVSFGNDGQCTIAGQSYKYRLQANNTLQIISDYSTDNYTYRVDRDKLQLSYQDGSTFDCTRQAASAVPGSVPGKSGTPQQQAGGNEWQLQGTFCHYSGSSSYSSSYSSTSRISFDGRGRWIMGSESSFSSDAGSAYSGGGVDNSGSYRVNGRQVIYTTSGGEQGMATINMQQGDGRITELYVGKDLYSPSLCN